MSLLLHIEENGATGQRYRAPREPSFQGEGRTPGLGQAPHLLCPMVIPGGLCGPRLVEKGWWQGEGTRGQQWPLLHTGVQGTGCGPKAGARAQSAKGTECPKARGELEVLLPPCITASRRYGVRKKHASRTKVCLLPRVVTLRHHD